MASKSDGSWVRQLIRLHIHVEVWRSHDTTLPNRCLAIHWHGMQRPRRRLRHFKSLEARNLRAEGSNESLEDCLVFYRLWQKNETADSSLQALSCIYTSDEVCPKSTCVLRKSAMLAEDRLMLRDG